MTRATVPEVVQNAGLDRRKGLGAEESELEEVELLPVELLVVEDPL